MTLIDDNLSFLRAQLEDRRGYDGVADLLAFLDRSSIVEWPKYVRDAFARVSVEDFPAVVSPVATALAAIGRGEKPDAGTVSSIKNRTKRYLIKES
jgi:hypothetical protein